MLGVASNITHSPIGQFVLTSPVEFSTGKFRQTGMKSPLKWHKQPGKKKGFWESLGVE